jgi:hypothetical protein
MNMVELTPELIEQLANEEVIAMESGPESMNRVTLTTESGHVIVADIIGISFGRRAAGSHRRRDRQDGGGAQHASGHRNSENH